jgi:hypothetical protein
VAPVVAVACAATLVGVQDGTRVNRGVTVAVGTANVGGRVGGGNGLRLLFGLTKIRKNTDTTHRIAINTRMVKIFHTTAEDSFLRGVSFASDKSKLSIHYLPGNFTLR